MGGSESSLNVPGGGTDGYHVLHVLPNSPGDRAGLDAFFDFIICINGVRLVCHDDAQNRPLHLQQNKDDDHLKTVCASSIDKPVQLVVFSSKDQSVRGPTAVFISASELF